MNKKIDMNITFFKKLNIEFFNNKCYPLGTSFTFILNQLSSLAYNDKFKLESYKNVGLLTLFFNTIQHSANEKLRFIAQKNHIQIKDSSLLEELDYPDITIEDISISAKDFKELTLLLLYIDEFLEIALKDDNLMKIEPFLFFFSTMKGYTVPNCTILNLDNDKNKNFIEQQNSLYIKEDISNKDVIKNNYANIVESDLDILKSLVTNNNLVYQYHCNDFVDILLASLKYVIEQQINLKNCELCNNFFIATHDGKRFCDNIRPQYLDETDEDYKSKRYTCSEYNRRVKSVQNLNAEKKAIRRVKANIRKRIREGHETEEYLTKWLEKVKEKKKDVTEYFYMTLEEYISWILNDSDIHGRRKKNGSPRNNKK